jgi:tetratricopeptide (TPR) repeat protein
MTQPQNLEETMPQKPQKQADPALAETQRVEAAPMAKPAKPRRGRWILGGIAVFAVLAGLGALGGYQLAVGARQSEQNLQNAVEANYQFQLGLIDLQNGACQRAKDRFVYVIQLVPDYPGAQDQLIQASLCVGVATAAPSDLGGADAPSGPTPTPDLRGAEQILADAQGQLAARSWDALLPLLDTLRKNFPDFNPIEVDRMYFIGYRNRGNDRIIAGDLERGIFDLNRAEEIGPLDADAQNYRQWAVWYIVGASFWEVDWTQSVEYFQLVAAAAPNLHDLSFFTAQQRLAEALIGYAGDLILQAGDLALNKQWCSAEAMMYEANGYSQLSPEVQPTADWYTEKCLLNGDEQ